jgi:ring-1,2-phenylacetyl-CoA epoxidase subunit PaaE
MHKNYTLEKDEVDKGYVLTCQATATSPEVILTFDDR